MRFSPLLVSNSIIQPLRYFFSNYAGADFKYNLDEKITKIEIGAVNDFNKIPVGVKPRVLVNRGTFQIRSTGLDDSQATAKSTLETKGLTDKKNMVFIFGEASVLIESFHEGSVELLTDMVTHFLVWSKPFLCNTQGFKNFATPMTVTEPKVSKEETEVFQTIITVPYMMEEHWQVKSDALKLKDFFITLAST
jgi:hypothetical protein